MNEVSKQAGYWMANHPGLTIKIYDIAGLVGAFWPKAMSKAAIEQGFRVTGIYPFNPEVFTDRNRDMRSRIIGQNGDVNLLSRML
jgi:hypothetical protein